MSPPDMHPFPLGPWLVDPVANEVRRDGHVVRLEPKAVAVLVHLAEHEGQAVTRADLLDAVWPDVVVTDASLTRCISQLRQALGDETARRIETIPKVGYRLRADRGTDRGAEPTSRTDEARRLWGLVVVVALAVGALTWWLAARAEPATVTYRVEVDGAVRDAVVAWTGIDGERREHAPAFPFVRALEAGPGTYRLSVRGRTDDGEVRASIVARRGDEVLVESTTSKTVEDGDAQTFRLDAFAQVDAP